MLRRPTVTSAQSVTTTRSSASPSAREMKYTDRPSPDYRRYIPVLLDLSRLIRVKRAAGRLKDYEVVAELKVLLEEIERGV